MSGVHQPLLDNAPSNLELTCYVAFHDKSGINSFLQRQKEIRKLNTRNNFLLKCMLLMKVWSLFC